jgi:hypothetical protein
MSLFVADASVVVKWFVPEIHSDAARRLLMLQHEYFAPDLLFAEAASTIWKKVRRKELTRKTGSSSWPMSAGLASRLVPVPGRRRVCPGECLGWNGIRLDVRCVGNSTEHALDHGRRTARSRIENACRHLTSTASMVGPLDLHVVSRSFVSDTGFEDHGRGRASGWPGAVQVETPASDVDQAARCGQPRRGSFLSDGCRSAQGTSSEIAARNIRIS